VSALALAEEEVTLAVRDGVSVVVRGQSTWTSRPSGRIDEKLAITSDAFGLMFLLAFFPIPFLFLIFSKDLWVFSVRWKVQDRLCYSSFLRYDTPLSNDPRS
jgi:hypothetical protein